MHRVYQQIDRRQAGRQGISCPIITESVWLHQMTDGCPTHVINDDSLQEKCAAKTMAMALYVRSFVRSTAMCVCLLACMSIVHTMFCFVRMYVCIVQQYRYIVHMYVTLKYIAASLMPLNSFVISNANVRINGPNHRSIRAKPEWMDRWGMGVESPRTVQYITQGAAGCQRPNLYQQYTQAYEERHVIHL